MEDEALLAAKTALAGLKIPDPLGGGRMHNGIRALALFREKLRGDKMIEGWIEGPIAEAADLRGINTLMLDFYDDPVFVRDLFEFVVAMGLRFGRARRQHALAEIDDLERTPTTDGDRLVLHADA